MPSMRSHGSSRRRSSTPQVKAPCDPPPCNARSTSTGSRSDFGSFAIYPRINALESVLFHRRELHIRMTFLPAEPSHIERRQEDQREDCANKKSAHDGEGHRTPEYRWCDRDHPEDRRDCRQHDRAKPRAAGIDRCLPHVLTLTSFGFNLVDQDHCVLRDHPEQRQNTEDGDEPERFAGQQQCSDDTDQSQRPDAEDDEQTGEASQLHHQRQ